MQISSTRVDRVPGMKTSKKPQSQLLSFYSDAPQEELSLDEFELFALDRLQLLRGIETLKTKGFEGSELSQKISLLENKYVPLRAREEKSSATRLTTDQRKDQASHFILRLAYCRTEELQRWFLQQECALFKHRLDRLSDLERQEFMAANGLQYESVSPEFRSARKDCLAGLLGVTEANIGSTSIYKIPFQQALQLVSSRQVYLESGFAFVPLPKILSIIVTRFRMNLSRSLAEAVVMFDLVNSDTRIGPLLKNMNKQYVGRDFSKGQATDKLSPENIDTAAENSMPLCMKNLHQSMKREHKLKHWGRLQYGLFLKGAGLTLEDALVFWESHFTKVMTHEQFTKQYKYSFGHMYGKEGSRKDYTPYSCVKIIMGTPPEAGAHHGCPYRHASDNQLASMLAAMKIGGTEVKEIVKIAKETGNYQLACARHFELTHPGHQQMEIRSEGVGNHPNQWYKTSVQYHKLKSGTATTGAGAGGGAIAAGAVAAGEGAPGDASFAEAVAKGSFETAGGAAAGGADSSSGAMALDA